MCVCIVFVFDFLPNLSLLSSPLLSSPLLSSPLLSSPLPQRASQERSTILDDQGDYYELATNQWLDDDEKKLAAHKAQVDAEREQFDPSKRKMKLTIGFSDDGSFTHDVQDATLEDHGLGYGFDVTKIETQNAFISENNIIVPSGSKNPHNAKDRGPKSTPTTSTAHFANPTLTGRAAQVYESLQTFLQESRERSQKFASTSGKNKNQNKNTNKKSADATDTNNSSMKAKPSLSRVQHDDPNAVDPMAALLAVTREIDEKADAADRGVCLSMHQPWASLLVLGIKRYEGRSWPTDYRGRLWIAAAAQEPSPDVIAQIEQDYRQVYGPDVTVPFPKEYPTACLLGCVDMVDCLDQSAFQLEREYLLAKKRPVEDSASAFLFKCVNPHAMLIPQSISGDHKLWRLPPDRIQSYQGALRPISHSWWTDAPKSNSKK
jgi:ASCH domain